MWLLSDLAEAFRNRSRYGTLVGMNARNVALVRGYNRREDYVFADDKILCKSLLERGGVAVPPTIATGEGLRDIPRLLALLRGRSNFVVKPASGSGGDGIVVVGEADEGGWQTAKGRFVDEAELGRHLAEIVFGAFSNDLEDRILIEERIVPHALFAEFFSGGVSDIRIILLEGVPLMGMVRIPTLASGGRANLHQGGIGVAMDLATGVTFRAVSRGESVLRHPETDGALIGRQLPHWEQTLEVARLAAASVPLGYVGVDIVVDAVRGPLVLELNARPGLEIQNINGRGLGAALAAAGKEVA